MITTFLLALFLILLLTLLLIKHNKEGLTKKLAVICSKSPNDMLLTCVNNLISYYPDFDIVVIDSDSDNFEIYEKLPLNVKIEYIKNKNYELGAWYFAFNKYHDYDTYMFIQDSIAPNKRIPDLEQNIEDNVYSFHYDELLDFRFNNNDDNEQMRFINRLSFIYKDSILDFIANLDRNTKICGAAHSSFIANKKNTSHILQLEEVYIQKNISKNKDDSWLSERTCGIMADSFKRIDISSYFDKTHGGR